ncbi:MAG: sulfatase [Myxococcales bacterium]|nr:sulfatase [Myxococcales bacterium]
MNAAIPRAVLPVAGAVFGAEIVGAFEALRMQADAGLPLLPLAGGDAAVVVPIATAVGLLVSAALLLLDPVQSLHLRGIVVRLRRLAPEARARSAAAALVIPPALLVWSLLSAHGARAALGRGSPLAAGVEMAAVSLGALVLVGAAIVATVPVAARTITADVGPLVSGACGSLFAIACSAVGVRLGDASGNEPTPLAILGVLMRRELDLSPVLAVLVLAACALAGAWVARDRRRESLLIGVAVILLAWGLVIRQASALSETPALARAIERGAPLGRIGLALARRATDHDGDGASALFGGGDCDDDDPRRSPDAIDVPGNGVDEDCSGQDLPLPPPPAPPPRAPRDAVPANLNLILVTIDTLRIDLGFMGYERPVSPHLDALAAKSTVFERAYAMASYTGKSVGPTLIGKYPSECVRDGGHFNVYGKANTLLTERLQEAGFHTMGAASHWYFKARYGLAQGMDLWDLSAIRSADPEQDSDSTVTSEALTDVVIGMLSEPANVDKRFFLWAHYFDPHAPYVPHPEAPDFRKGARSWAKPLYDGEVWYTDHHLGRLLDYVASQPWGARTAIIVTADHGEAFDEHGMNWHGGDVWEPLVRVPLVIYVPGVAAHRVPLKRSLIDLVPTALDLLGIPQPPAGELSGESMASEVVSPDEAAGDERDVFMDVPWGPRVSQHRALIHGATPGLKLMHEGGPQYLLFDLAKDPGELSDLSRQRQLLEGMTAVYQEKLATLHELRADPSL